VTLVALITCCNFVYTTEMLRIYGAPNAGVRCRGIGRIA
jgi:hypothetical protein